MVELVNHKHGFKSVMSSMQRARRLINRHLSEYIEYEDNLKKHILDLDESDQPPKITTYSILVNDQVVWTNKHLF